MKQLENNSGMITDIVNKRMFGELQEYQTVIENIIFGTRKLNMNNARFTEEMVQKYIGGAVLKDLYNFQNVDIGLKGCFVGLDPTPAEKKHFLAKFLARWAFILSIIYIFFDSFYNFTFHLTKHTDLYWLLICYHYNLI